MRRRRTIRTPTRNTRCRTTSSGDAPMTLWRRLTRRLRHLDLHWTVRRGVRVRVVEQPGLWMPPDAIAALLAELRDVVRRGIGEDLDYGIVTGEPERLRNAVVTVVYDAATGTPVAF